MARIPWKLKQPPVGAIEKAYIRGLKEGMRRGVARQEYLRARVSELVIRLKAAKGELRRAALNRGPASAK